MERLPALRTVIWLILGIVLAAHISLPFLCLFIVCTILITSTLILHLLAPHRSSIFERFANIGIVLSLINIGWLNYAIQIDLVPRNSINYFLNLPRPVFIIGNVDSAVEAREYNSLFLMEIDEIDTGGRRYKVQGKILVKVQSPQLPCAYGDRLRIAGKLRAPEEARNPEAFNQKKFLERKGIHGLLRVWQVKNIEIIDRNRGNFFLATFIFPVKQHIYRTIDSNLTGNIAALLKGILLGERRSLPRPIAQMFADVGVVHILAVSGLHVGFITLIVLVMFQTLSRFITGLPYGFPYGMTIICLIYYVILVGAPPSAIRASVMIIAFLIGAWLERRSLSLNTIAVAALLILLVLPQMLFTVGFQLSFSATFAIIHLHRPLSRLLPSSLFEYKFSKYVMNLAIVSLAAVLGTMPVLAYTFNQVSLISVVANLYVIPQMLLVVSLGFVSVIVSTIHFSFAIPFLAIDAILLYFTIWVVDNFSQLPFASLNIASPSLLVIIFYYTLLILTPYLRASMRARKVLIYIVLGLISILVWQAALSDDIRGKQLTVTFLDVGQGDCSLVEFPNGKTMLIDGGDPGNGYRVILPFLKKNGIRHLDYVVNTHPHRDHLGGIMEILPETSIGTVIDSGQPYMSYTYLNYLKHLAEKEIPRVVVRANDEISIDPNVSVKVLHPIETFVFNSLDSLPEAYNVNNVSVVLKITYRDVGFLFTGDAEEEVDPVLLQNFGSELQSTILKVPHHGSNTSSTLPLLRAVRPSVAVIQCGEGNKFFHPHPTILKRYRRLGTKIYRTELDGAVQIRADGQSIRIQPTLKRAFVSD